MYRLNKDIMAMMVASVVRLKNTILFRISHFGMNPVRGGSPPKDRIDSVRADVSWGEAVHITPRSLIVVDIVECSIMKIGVVERM